MTSPGHSANAKEGPFSLTREVGGSLLEGRWGPAGSGAVRGGVMWGEWSGEGVKERQGRGQGCHLSGVPPGNFPSGPFLGPQLFGLHCVLCPVFSVNSVTSS